eukprot:GHVN01031266.1.p1 GENE.GHVN01031266.1~~GHVN01031266.1.p1  ORF type:complete len:144 (+),score=22.28 GHVN01031266.1:430-861(+)
MIRFFLLQNRQGKTRLSKWYANFFSYEERLKIEREVHRTIVLRDRRWTNFLEYRNFKLVYRQYAGLVFTLCVDVNDNELGMYQLIHLFVEALDSFFGSVCELDVVLNFDKVYQILDEIVLNGEVSESAYKVALSKVKATAKLE